MEIHSNSPKLYYGFNTPCIFGFFIITANPVHAHTPPVPPPQQYSHQRERLQEGQARVWQYICLPVSFTISSFENQKGINDFIEFVLHGSRRPYAYDVIISLRPPLGGIGLRVNAVVRNVPFADHKRIQNNGLYPQHGGAMMSMHKVYSQPCSNNTLLALPQLFNQLRTIWLSEQPPYAIMHLSSFLLLISWSQQTIVWV